MNPMTVLTSLLNSSNFAVRFARAATGAGAAIAASNGGRVNWSSVGLFALMGFLGAGEPNATPPKA